MTENSARAQTEAAAAKSFIQTEALACDEQGRWLLVQPQPGQRNWQLVGGPTGAFEAVADATSRLSRAQIGYELTATRALLINRDIARQQMQMVVGTERIYFDELRLVQPSSQIAGLRFVFPREAKDMMPAPAYERASAAFKMLSGNTSACAFLENGKASLRATVLAF